MNTSVNISVNTTHKDPCGVFREVARVEFVLVAAFGNKFRSRFDFAVRIIASFSARHSTGTC